MYKRICLLVTAMLLTAVVGMVAQTGADEITDHAYLHNLVMRGNLYDDINLAQEVYAYSQDGIKSVFVFNTKNGCIYTNSNELSSIEVPVRVFDSNNNELQVDGIVGHPIIDSRSGVYSEAGEWFDTSLKQIIFPESIANISTIAGFSNHLALTDVKFAGVCYDNLFLNRGSFVNCPKLQIVDLPEGLLSINQSFIQCESLKSVNLPESLQSLDDQSFSGCKNLKELHIPAGVEYIGAEILTYCPSLRTITIEPSNVCYESGNGCNAIIDRKTKQLVKGCSGSNIPLGVTSLGPYSFAGSGIEEVVIPNSVVEICENAFLDCRNLKHVILSDGLKRIGNNAFQGCVNLEIVQLNDSLMQIGDMAFKDCQSLKSIFVPQNVNNIGKDVWIGCMGLEKISVDKRNPVYDSRKACNAIIETQEDKIVFGITNTTIPQSVRSVGAHAFAYSMMENLSLPKNIECVESGAFAYCASLKKISVNRGNKFYDSREDCNALIDSKSGALVTGCASTVIPNSVNSIGNEAFRGVSFRKSDMALPSNISNIGIYAFAECENLQTLSLPNNLTFLGDYAFSGIEDLSKVYIGNVDSWGMYSFADNKNLRTLQFSDDLETIGSYAFNKCIGLEYVSLPDALSKIGVASFNNCINLSFISLPKGLKEIETYAFHECNSLLAMDLPDGLQRIGYNAFARCNSLQELDVPSSVISFKNQENLKGLRSIKLSKSYDLETLRFPGCYNLEKVVLH